MSPKTPQYYKTLEDALGYRFIDSDFCSTALTHKSYINERSDSTKESNERMEFLGDAVLDLVVSHLLMETHREVPEGVLSKWRAALVNEKSLARKARILNLGAYLLLGKGEDRSGGRDKDSILSDTFEAMLGAVYLEGGYNDVFRVIRYHFLDEILSLSKDRSSEDFKTRLQEFTQSVLKVTPRYRLAGEEGPDHDKVFYVELNLRDGLKTTGSGKSKKEAEQWAARHMLEMLETRNPKPDTNRGEIVFHVDSSPEPVDRPDLHPTARLPVPLRVLQPENRDRIAGCPYRRTSRCGSDRKGPRRSSEKGALPRGNRFLRRRLHRSFPNSPKRPAEPGPAVSERPGPRGPR